MSDSWKKNKKYPHYCLERRIRTIRKRTNADVWHKCKLQWSWVLRLVSLFSYPVTSLSVSVFIVPLHQRGGEPMMLPLIRDAVGWEQLVEDWSVGGGKEGSKFWHLYEKKGLLDDSEEVLLLSWRNDEVFSASFLHLKWELGGQLE